jgi:hypothetical protein
MSVFLLCPNQPCSYNIKNCTMADPILTSILKASLVALLPSFASLGRITFADCCSKDWWKAAQVLLPTKLPQTHWAVRANRGLRSNVSIISTLLTILTEFAMCSVTSSSPDFNETRLQSNRTSIKPVRQLILLNRHIDCIPDQAEWHSHGEWRHSVHSLNSTSHWRSNHHKPASDQPSSLSLRNRHRRGFSHNMILFRPPAMHVQWTGESGTGPVMLSGCTAVMKLSYRFNDLMINATESNDIFLGNCWLFRRLHSQVVWKIIISISPIVLSDTIIWLVTIC